MLFGMKPVFRYMMMWMIVGLTMVSCKSLRRGSASSLASSVPAVAESVCQGEPTDERSIAADASADRLITDYVQEEVVVSDPDAVSQMGDEGKTDMAVVPSSMSVPGKTRNNVASQTPKSSAAAAKPVLDKTRTKAVTKGTSGSATGGSPNAANDAAGSSPKVVSDAAGSSRTAANDAAGDPAKADKVDTAAVAGKVIAADTMSAVVKEPLPGTGDSTSIAACIFVADDEEPATNGACFKILLGILILLIVLFVLYIIYTRAREKKLLRHLEKDIEDYKKKHGGANREASGDIDRMLQRHLNAAVTALKRERDTALALAESARVEKEAVLSTVQDAMASEDGQVTDLQARLAVQEADLTARESRISDQLREMSEIEAAFAVKEAEFDRLSQNLKGKEAELASMSAQLAEKESALLQMEAGLTQKAAELADMRLAFEARVEEMETAARKIDEERAEMATQSSTSAVMSLPAQDRTEETNIIRRMLIAKIEAGQTILGLKGAKKGEVLSSEEWDEIENYLEIADKGFLKRLKDMYPGLTRKDIELMMLLRLRIPSKSIASVYGINEKSIKQKLFIYKEKVGLGGDTTSLRELIENL